MRFAGKQWHAPKKAFRPASGLTSFEQRVKTRVAQAATKAKEKELKEEKEAERQVRSFPTVHELICHQGMLTLEPTETGAIHQGEARSEGGEGTVRAAGGKDAQEAAGAVEAQREAQQASQLLIWMARKRDTSPQRHTIPPYIQNTAHGQNSACLHGVPPLDGSLWLESGMARGWLVGKGSGSSKPARPLGVATSMAPSLASPGQQGELDAHGNGINESPQQSFRPALSIESHVSRQHPRHIPFARC